MTILMTHTLGIGRVSRTKRFEDGRVHPASQSNHQKILAALRFRLSRQNSNWDPSTSTERGLNSLAEETNPEIFYMDLLHWAGSQKAAGNLATAASVYAILAGEDLASGETLEVSEEIRQEAQENLAVLQGGGSLGARLEFQAGTFMEGVFSPPVLLGMAAGSTVFTTTRSLILPKLCGHSARNFLTTGWGARLLASTTALGTETLAFWSISKGMETYLHPGSQSWDWGTNGREIATMMLTLGLLRSNGFVFSRTHQWAVQANRSMRAGFLTQAFAGGGPILWHQGGMFAGILMSHGVESRLGWRNSQALDAFLLDSLMTLVQFNAAGALSQGAFPGLYRRNSQLESRLRLQEASQWRQYFQNNLGRGTVIENPALGLQTVPAAGIRVDPGRLRARDLYLLSSAINGGEGPSSAPKRPGTFRQLLRKVKDIPDLQDSVEALALLYITSVGELRPSIFESLVALRENQGTSERVVSELLNNPRARHTDFFSPDVRQKVSERIESFSRPTLPPTEGRRRRPTPPDLAGLPKAFLSNLTVSELLLRLHRLRLEEFSRGLQEGNLSISQKDAANELAVLARYFDNAVSKHERQAETDFLTGLLNKRGLERVTPRLENRLLAYSEYTGGKKKADWVLMIDIDHFKRVNDTYGHPNGDEVLRSVANTLKDSIRYRDISARIGGEEFFILLAKAGQDGAARVAESLRLAVSEKDIPLSGFDPIRVTVSLGAAPMRTIRSVREPGEWITQGALFDAKERADRALYEAKGSGRNRVQISMEGRIPWRKIKQRPTISRFQRLLEEVAIPPEELAMELNWKFSSDINLSRYASYTGRAIYISDPVDVAKLKHYGRLDYQSLGEILFFARKDLSRNWTITDASRPDRIGIRRERLSDMERNQRKPTEEELESFSRIYNLTLENLREARDRTRFRRRLKSQF